jgi:hypothetical protein
VTPLQTFLATKPIDPFVVDLPILPQQEGMNPSTASIVG